MTVQSQSKQGEREPYFSIRRSDGLYFMGGGLAGARFSRQEAEAGLLCGREFSECAARLLDSLDVALAEELDREPFTHEIFEAAVTIQPVKLGEGHA